MRNKRRWLNHLLGLVLAVAVAALPVEQAQAAVNPATSKTAVTSTAQLVTFGVPSPVVSIMNSGPYGAYITWGTAPSTTAVAAGTGSAYLAACTVTQFTFPSKAAAPTYASLVAESAQTATVWMSAFGEGGLSPVNSTGPVVSTLALPGCVGTSPTYVDLALSGNETVGGTLGVTGASTLTGKVTTAAQFVVTPTSQTVADSGNGSAATGTVAATVGKVYITCSDSDGCAMTLSETSATSGASLTIVNVSANNMTLADTSGVSETTGAITLGQWDSITYNYVVDRWVEATLSNN